MNIEQMTIDDIRAGYINKVFTCKELTSEYIGRIKKYDGIVNAFNTLQEEVAIKEAEIIDNKIELGENIGPLGGIPVAIKDNISTRGIKTTCSSKILEDYVPPYDATIVEKLKSAGAIIIGKTNMDEFAMGSSTENSAFQITKNPWNLKCVPGGSSGGSAAAVAAGFSPIAIGSDTGGSIRQPAAFCGVVGIKPTYGLVSRFGLIAFASSLDQIGPMTKTVKDCALTLSVIQGEDERDETSYRVDTYDDYSNIDENIKGLKIGVPKEFFREGLDDNIYNTINKTIKTLEKLGAKVEECSLPITESGLSAYYIISSAEASSNLARYDGIRYGYRSEQYDSIDELIVNSRTEGFGKEVKRRIMLGTYVLSSGYYDAYYKKAQLLRNKIRNYFDDAYKHYDLLLSPTSPILPFTIGEKANDPLEMYLADIYTVNINIAGLPAISIPCGFSKTNLPIGLQLIGNYFTEQKIFKTAFRLEQELGLTHKVPSFQEV